MTKKAVAAAIAAVQSDYQSLREMQAAELLRIQRIEEAQLPVMEAAQEWLDAVLPPNVLDAFAALVPGMTDARNQWSINLVQSARELRRTLEVDHARISQEIADRAEAAKAAAEGEPAA